MGFLPGNWEKCKGMNGRNKKCADKFRHLNHKYVAITKAWYGQLPKNPKDKIKLPDPRTRTGK